MLLTISREKHTSRCLDSLQIYDHTPQVGSMAGPLNCLSSPTSFPPSLPPSPRSTLPPSLLCFPGLILSDKPLFHWEDWYIQKGISRSPHAMYLPTNTAIIYCFLARSFTSLHLCLFWKLVAPLVPKISPALPPQGYCSSNSLFFPLCIIPPLLARLSPAASKHNVISFILNKTKSSLTSLPPSATALVYSLLYKTHRFQFFLFLFILKPFQSGFYFHKFHQNRPHQGHQWPTPW